MTSLALLIAALVGTAAPADAGPSKDAAARDAANWNVLLSQYPARARAAGEQGSVGFNVALDREGYATSCVVTQRSGFKRLDEETCELILDRGSSRASGARGPQDERRYRGRRQLAPPEGQRPPRRR
jgi:hypothetical protein